MSILQVVGWRAHWLVQAQSHRRQQIFRQDFACSATFSAMLPPRAWLALNRATLLDTFAPAAASTSKPVPGAWAALLQNMALELSTGANTDLGAEAKAQVLSASGALLTAPTNEDVTFRFALPVCMAALCLPCLGELAWSCRCSLRGLTCICPVSALERY